jgi:hypothetical protein
MPLTTVSVKSDLDDIAKGLIYILESSSGSSTSGVGILATIPAPTLTAGVATQLPWAQCSIPTAPGPLDAQNIWIDSDNDGEGVQVSILVG